MPTARTCTASASAQGKNGTPVWSPRGDLIAFTKISGGAFHIGVMRPDGSGERMLTNGWQDEGPTWAPNGRVMMFTRTLQTAQRRARLADLVGRCHRAATSGGC